MELSERVVKLESEVSYLRERDATLNGSIQRTERKVEEMSGKFSTLLGSIVVSLILLALNLALQLAQKGGQP